MNKIFILGEKDPEMDAIQEILDINSLDYVFAYISGIRCHPGNSY